MKKALAITALAGSLWASAVTAGDQGFHYYEKSVEPATYYAAITNLANAVMFSGLGEELIVSPYERDDWLRRSGYVTRPPMPDMGIVGPVYAGALPVFKEMPDFSRPETLRWKPDSFDRTLDPGAQAWTLLKITSPQFHLQFHDLPENRIAALMMLPQAREQARLLGDRLRNGEGLFAPRSPDGTFLAANPRDQAAVLWAVSNLILASTSWRDDYWHQAYRDLVKADDYRSLADLALAAVIKLPPGAATERAVAVEALGRYALIAGDAGKRRQALDLARQHAESLRADAGKGLEDLAMSVYGLTEAGRLLKEQSFSKAATDLFRTRLMASWNAERGIFSASGDKSVYTPRIIGAVVAALNAMRWHGPDNLAAEARRLYPRFFENAVIRSGLLRASPLPLVSGKYREAQPAANFAHPSLPMSKDTGIAPVFASQVSYGNGRWEITDSSFRTAEAMFLAHMLALSSDGRSDTFLPEDRMRGL